MDNQQNQQSTLDKTNISSYTYVHYVNKSINLYCFSCFKNKDYFHSSIDRLDGKHFSSGRCRLTRKRIFTCRMENKEKLSFAWSFKPISLIARLTCGIPLDWHNNIGTWNLINKSRITLLFGSFIFALNLVINGPAA